MVEVSTNEAKPLFTGDYIETLKARYKSGNFGVIKKDGESSSDDKFSRCRVFINIIKINIFSTFCCSVMFVVVKYLSNLITIELN